jgi:ethanolamine utilization cobalamin adenosyltransferase
MKWFKRTKEKSMEVSRSDIIEIITILSIVAFVLLLFYLFV